MKIISNSIEKEIIILSYFKLNDNNNNIYLLYTDELDEKEKKIYICKVLHIGKRVEFFSPDNIELLFLNDIINNFTLDNTDEQKLKKNKYKYIDISALDDIYIEEISSHKIFLSNDKYIKLLSNKYLTYPTFKIINIEEIEKQGYDKYNKKFIPYSIIALSIYYLILIISYLINPKPLNNLLSLNGINITMWSLIILLISMSAYNFEDKEFKESFPIVFIIIWIFLIILTLLLNKFNFINIILISLIYSIIFTIPYSITKKISFYFINRFRCRNYITFYCIYLIPFSTIFLLLLSIYNNYLFNYISISL